ncbi:hypothetical protein D6D02_07357 [Aureobasidium pullulans]|uniref:pH-response transcription factor pacC/RIM101 n=1 Tax=Aureobasidium pullulans TaxID=5580 RepID=A0A4S8VJ13_AURPU|nr:hypothetical protein D6D24_06890 [Aureobasidium pullulans]THY06945.1 hypothetical protein D6D02_07357 [Aureobasidium pullulans]
MSDTTVGAPMAPQNHPDPAAAAAAAAAAQQLQQASPTQQHQQLQAHQLQHQPLQQQSLAQQSLQQSPTIQHALQSPMQQHASPQPVQQHIGTPSLGQSSTVDSLTCQWLNCGERHQTAEALYEHVCERHVGRKSTNNLNLTCHWGSCRVTTVKRDHITSHIRVHVPLKPHKCDFCGKAFKRPQDLKKHVKTHADDSVLLRSPDPNMGQNRPPGNNYQQGQPANNGYYGHDLGATNGYPHPNHGLNSNNFFQQPQQQPQYAGYGQVNYPASNSLADIQSMDTRRRAIEALNDFLGDIKRRAIDPGNYYDVGQRLQSANLPLPISTGYGYSTGNNYASNNNSSYSAASSLLDSFNNSGNMQMTGGSGGSMSQGPLTQSYSLPLPSNARTKQDLVEIDKFLEQLQATVYESSNSAAAAGVQQPGSHAQYTNYPGFGSQYRNSDSPPSMQHSGSVSTPGVGSLSNMPSSSAMDTPALTPASVSSYTSAGQSPMSTHSRSSMSSVHGSSMYPSLPSVTAISDMGAGYPATTSAPASGLASGFEGFEGRRYSGGRLQREAPAPRPHDLDSDAMETESEGAKTPRASTRQPEDSSSLDPALRAASQTSTAVQSPSTGAGSDSDEKQATWVENVRVIEALRRWVSERINNQEFEGEAEYPETQHHVDHDMHMDHQPSEDKVLEPQYEQVHHPEHIQHEQHEQHEQAHEQQQTAPEHDASVAYPVLKVEE